MGEEEGAEGYKTKLNPSVLLWKVTVTEEDLTEFEETLKLARTKKRTPD